MSNARRGHMGGHGGGMSGEKAKDFKTAMKRLLSYMKRYRPQMACMFVFAIGSTVFSIIGQRFWERQPQSCIQVWCLKSMAAAVLILGRLQPFFCGYWGCIWSAPCSPLSRD